MISDFCARNFSKILTYLKEISENLSGRVECWGKEEVVNFLHRS